MAGEASLKAAILGKHGLIGSALARRLGPTTSFPTPETKVLFHFASYAHPTFDTNPDYLMKQTIDSFTALLPICAERGTLFVYPSSALVYEKDTRFSRFKKTLEQLVRCYEASTLGVRIFPVYGPGESGTVISQWCRGMKKGEAPRVYGDGTQSRDFIYVDDVADQILSLAEEQAEVTHRVVDIGTGTRTSFGHIVDLINAALGTHIAPEYVPAPAIYPSGIQCKSPVPFKVPVEMGIRHILTSLP